MIRVRCVCVAWFLAAFLVTPVAHADLYTAEAAYQKKDFARAFELFRELAELGHPMAQETLAVMYVQGEGVARDNALGYAWATIAQSNGSSEAAKSIVDQLGPHMNETARQRVQAVVDKFGKAALEKRLLPLPHTAAELAMQPERAACRMTRPANPDDYYPPQAVKEGVSGSVVIRTTVMPDGHARNPRVTFSVPPNAFDAAGRNVALATGYAVPQENGVGVPCSIVFKVRFTIRGEGAPSAVSQHVVKLKAAAEAGDPLSQFQYAALLTGWHELNPQQQDMTPMFLKAAQAGIRSAQFYIGRGLLMRREPAEYQKGLLWLKMAADAGQQDAQIELAIEILRRGDGAEGGKLARELLEKAVASGSEDAGYYLADQLIGGAEASQRNPRRALDLISEVYAIKNDDPSTLEIRAAAFSQLENFSEAARVQSNALRKAKKLGWSTGPQTQRLELYRKEQAWTQSLLVY